MDVKPGYKLTEVGVIPEDWEVKALAELFTFQNGVNATKAAYGSGTPFINVLEVISYPFLAEGTIPGRIKLSSQVAKTFTVHHGDVLFNRTSETQQEVGLAAVYVGTGAVVFGGFVIRARPRSYSMAVEFSAYNLRSQIVRSQVVALGQGAVRANVGQQDLSRVLIPLPTKAEQQSIAEALSEAEALIESLDLLLTKKRQIKQGAMQELLAGKRRLPGLGGKRGCKMTEVGVIPTDWEVMRVRNLVRQGPQNGFSGPSSDDARGTPTLSLAATSSGHLIMRNATVKRLHQVVPSGSPLFLEPNDVLVQRSNTTDLVGTTAIFDGPGATYIYPDLMMRLRFRERVVGQWFWRYANSPRGRSYFRGAAAGSTGTMPKISGERLREMPLPMPPPSEQMAIVGILSDMDAEISALETKLTKACQLKQGMMQELLTGRIRLI